MKFAPFAIVAAMTFLLVARSHRHWACRCYSLPSEVSGLKHGQRRFFFSKSFRMVNDDRIVFILDYCSLRTISGPLQPSTQQCGSEILISILRARQYLGTVVA